MPRILPATDLTLYCLDFFDNRPSSGSSSDHRLRVDLVWSETFLKMNVCWSDASGMMFTDSCRSRESLYPADLSSPAQPSHMQNTQTYSARRGLPRRARTPTRYYELPAWLLNHEPNPEPCHSQLPRKFAQTLNRQSLRALSLCARTILSQMPKDDSSKRLSKESCPTIC
jgi:hypothetical protein